LDRGQGGVLEAPSAYFCKHPARQFSDDEAYTMVEDFINDDSASSISRLKRVV
jgi:myo-inositol-1-phosphate synthase